MPTSRGEVDILTIALTSDGDLSAAANRNKLVKQTATGIVLAAANDRVLGVLTNKPATGKPAQIQVKGVAKVMAGAAVSIGDYVKSDASGRAITSTGEAAGTLVEVVGLALEAAGAAGDLIAVLLDRTVINRAVS